MVTIYEALDTVYAHVTPKGTHILPIEDALGAIVAHPYHASFDLPRFDNSAMDGYAVKVADANTSVRLKEITYAGDRPDKGFASGEAIKIMTGAPTPNGCEAIVPIEDVVIKGEKIKLPENIQHNAMIRHKGEDVQKGECFLHAQQRVTAYTLALLASQGISHIEVYRKPKVVIFSTGEELKAHYERIEPHQLYNSNAPMFYARALELGCDVSYLSSSGDTLEALKQSIRNASDADLIITSGGISVGDKDFTLQAFEELGMETLFSRVNIKPGKPTTFGKLPNGYVVNLPGNPLAAMVNFEMFVKPIIKKLSGTASFYHASITTQMRNDFAFRRGKYTVMLGRWDGESFEPLKNQKPGMVSPLDKADGMIVTAPEVDTLNKHQEVKMIPIKLNTERDTKEDFLIRM